MKYYSILAILALFFIFSCVSSPDEAYNTATKNREKVIRYELKEYAEAEYNQAEKSYQEAKDAMAKRNNSKAKKALDIANKNYLIVLEKGLPKHSDKKEKESLDEKRNAESIKADVAVKNDFNDANKVYNEGVVLKNDKKYEESIEKFIVAKEKFNAVYKVTKEKKDKTEQSLAGTDKALVELKEKVDKLNREIEANVTEDNSEIKQNKK